MNPLQLRHFFNDTAPTTQTRVYTCIHASMRVYTCTTRAYTCTSLCMRVYTHCVHTPACMPVPACTCLHLHACMYMLAHVHTHYARMHNACTHVPTHTRVSRDIDKPRPWPRIQQITQHKGCTFWTPQIPEDLCLVDQLCRSTKPKAMWGVMHDWPNHEY